MQHTYPRSLRRARRVTGLTQSEVSFLLGTQDGLKVSRYERESRYPNLHSVLALEIILRSSVAALYPHVHGAVAEQLRTRMMQLIGTLNSRPDHPATSRKLDHLQASLAALTPPNPDHV